MYDFDLFNIYIFLVEDYKDVFIFLLFEWEYMWVFDLLDGIWYVVFECFCSMFGFDGVEGFFMEFRLDILL